jgi:hypothetical protein
MNRDFGFGRKASSLDISGFERRDRDVHTGDRDLADKAADRSGFPTREKTERLARNRKPSQPSDQAYVRASIEVINRFKQFCNDEGLSYGEALEELMRRSGV